MSDLSEQKRAAMAQLIESAPDEMLASIAAAFRGSRNARAQAVCEAAEAARLNRAARALALGPVLPLFSARADGVRAPAFQKFTLNRLWAELGARRPEAIAILTARLRSEEFDAPSVLVDGLCAEAASLLRDGEVGRWGLSSEEEAEQLAAYFELAPLARAALPRLHDWLGRLSEERGVALRLAFKDAAAVRDDGAARLLEILMSHLGHAGQVLRLIAAITDGAREGFIRSSELSDFGERLVEFVEAQAGRLKRLGPRATIKDAEDAIEALEAATEVITEFSLSIPQSSDGDWTRRLTAARGVMSSQLESTLRSAEKLVDKALPLSSTRIAGRMSRLAPNLAADPEAPAVGEARAVLVVLDGTRGLAAAMGCESLRSQVAEAVAARADSYAEEVLQALHAGEVEDVPRALALLDVAAEVLALSRGAQAAALVRRRAAVALASEPGSGEAA